MFSMKQLIGVFLVMLLAAGSWITPALAQDPVPDTVAANVILCADPDCADTVNLQTMYGATVTSYAPDGSMVSTCTVTETPSGMSNCDLIPAPDRGSYDIRPADPYVGYVLLSVHPEVFESEMHGPIYVWYFAPEKDNIAPPFTQAPLPTAVPVVGLPSTGSGGAVGAVPMLALVPFVIAGAAAVVNRLTRD